MKIDKKNPWHWLYLVLMLVNVIVALAAQRLRKSRPGKRQLVLFYGHKLNGNLQAIYRHIREHENKRFRARFLTMDPAYYRILQKKGEDVVLAISPEGAVALSVASAMVSDHGLHAMSLLVGRTSIRFFDVWHGVPYKGFDGDDFRLQHKFDETWVASNFLRNIYINRYKFPPERTVATGYARTDRLVNAKETKIEILQALGLPTEISRRPIVLFAPTWKQEEAKRSVFPFGLEELVFLEELGSVCQRHDAVLAIRKHLNTKLMRVACAPSSEILHLPYAEFPDSEQILLLADVLICDWSSISFDYLLLKRPTIFLDVPCPFGKGFTLGPEFRTGMVVKGLHSLSDALQIALSQRGNALEHQKKLQEASISEIYNEFADGDSSRRCVERMIKLLN